ncbi:unnamed protein product, partial [Ilex paraguariensis]
MVMGSSSGEESDLSELEINEYKEKPYEELRSGRYKVKGPNGTLRCPFCAGKKKHDYKSKGLYAHASGVGKDSFNRKPQRQRVVASAPAEQNSEYNDLYVWPWTGIFVNIVNEPKNWEAVGSEGYWLAKFSKYKPSGIEIFLDDQGLVAQAVVKFDNDWTGFKNAMEFEKFFETEHHSKKEWNVEESHHNSNIYGWIAREDDYNSEGPVGDYLRRKGVLKTIPNLVQEATQHKNYIVANRANEIDMKTENLDELQIKYNEKFCLLVGCFERKTYYTVLSAK